MRRQLILQKSPDMPAAWHDGQEISLYYRHVMMQKQALRSESGPWHLSCASLRCTPKLYERHMMLMHLLASER